MRRSYTAKDCIPNHKGITDVSGFHTETSREEKVVLGVYPDMHGGFGGGSKRYGTYKHGRLSYRTAEEARGAAADLGINDVHPHQVNGETVFMPGSSCDELNATLDRRGLPKAERCMGGKSAGSDDDGMFGAGLGAGAMGDLPSFGEMDKSDEWGF